jgi:hypothetical protein
MEPIDVSVECPCAICVEFPGRVNNVDKAVEMLGGYQVLTKGLAQANPILSCRNRPQVSTAH